MLIVINSICGRCTADYQTESALSIFPPKLWDGTTGLGFDNKGSHGSGRLVPVSESSGTKVVFKEGWTSSAWFQNVMRAELG